MTNQTGFTNSAEFKCLEDLHGDYVDLSLSYCGTEDCRPGFGFGPGTRSKYVIHIVTKGSGIFKTNNKTYRLKENQAFLIYPDTLTYYEADKQHPWSYMWVGFDGIKALECLTTAGFTPEQPLISLTCMDTLIACVTGMLDAHQLTFANDLKRSGLLMQFLSAIIEDQAISDPEQSSYDYAGTVYVKYAVNYLTQNYAQKIKIADLAKYIGINRSYLTNSFKKAMNLSPQEFLVNLRMDKAVSLLQNTTLPINIISARIGYDDPLAFSKIFKKKYGLSPKQFRADPTPLIETDGKGRYQSHSPL